MISSLSTHIGVSISILIDTGYISRENAIAIVQDRTNHKKDKLIENFWNTYNDYAKIDDRILELIKKLKTNNYKIYLLSKCY